MLLDEISRQPWILEHRIAEPHTEVTDLFSDSRRVAPGSAFYALRGEQFDGHDFIGQALTRGAAAIFVTDRAHYRALAGENQPAVFLTAGGRETLADLAGAIYGYPANDLALLGVTGTNGKTTVVHLVEQLCGSLGMPCGVIGSLGMRLGTRVIAAERTTPESTDIAGFLRDIVACGTPMAAMEVSSIGVALERTRGLRFRAAAFTNLSQDHLDFHGDMTRYREQKFRLFEEYDLNTAVLNAEAPECEVLIGQLGRQRPNLEVMTFAVDAPADLKVEEYRRTGSGFEGVLDLRGRRCPFKLPLIGAFNLSNMLAAMGLMLAAGCEADSLAAAAADCHGAPGRFERVPLPQPFTAVVDYAHTPDALQHVLSVAREVCSGRVLVVFGCGGDRDVAKRPLMGAVAASLADEVVITSDNPRGEDPAAIVDQVAAGIPPEARSRVRCIVDRAEAIAQVLDAALPEDLVVAAGKGHETYQEIAGERIPFDDRVEIRRWAEDPRNSR